MAYRKLSGTELNQGVGGDTMDEHVVVRPTEDSSPAWDMSPPESGTERKLANVVLQNCDGTLIDQWHPLNTKDRELRVTLAEVLSELKAIHRLLLKHS